WVQRQWDSMGRLTALGTTGLQSTEGRDHLVQPLIGQILGRRYHYDSLGQLVAIEQAGAPSQAAQLLRYGYDSAGRLRAATDSQDPQTTARWQIDPAGNRLPALGAPGAPGQTNTQDSWAAQVHAHWRHTDFNLMGLGHLAGQRQGPVQRWEDNRIGFSEDRVWRYDPCGNRIAQMHADHSQQQLHYDGAHQLIAVRSSQIQGNAEQLRHHSRYTYDALGRRLKQQVESADSTTPTRTHYYGWDGDRLIHTERLQHGDDTRHIEHTIYEPGSFTPLVRLSTTASGDPQDEPHLLVQAIAAGLPDPDDPNHTPALALMQTMLDAMPRDMQQDAARHLRHTLDHGLPPGAQAMLGEQADSTARLLTGMQTQLQKQEKEQQARIAIHHYHCDHLGTPMALTDQRGLVAWAAKLDPWGNVLQEYNPQGIHQAIRLPGQHHDRETGLYYNRHRYYDPVVGSYVNQDPIGLAGGVNKSIYAINPMISMDPLGLAPVKTCAERILKAAEKLNNQERYSYASNYGFGSKRNKCNLFVHEVLENADVESPSRYRFGIIPRGPATAGDWANPQKAIPGFEIVTSPKPGDIVAVAYPYGDATGHVAVVTGSSTTIGAGSEDGSHSTGWPWNGASPKGNPIYRRCKD
ncbi:RHS repeat-associated core domain-containing protein, partial [Delftia sp. CH05]|uniref:RHS repeat-associated core domain-containing protein n=1 Tax=Delftia sp. CH05 TaxID=2692194 RepID=UPI00135EE548